MNFGEKDLVKYRFLFNKEGNSVVEYWLPKSFNIYPIDEDPNIEAAHQILQFQEQGYAPTNKISISFSILSREINPIDWLLARIEKSITPIILRTYTHNKSTNGCLLIKKNNRYIFYATLKYGSMLFCFTLLTYDYQKDIGKIFFTSISSFKFISNDLATSSSYAEIMKISCNTVTLLRKNQLVFSHPESWIASTIDQNIYYLKNMYSDLCCGEIFIFASSVEINYRKLIVCHKNFLEKIGYLFNGFICNEESEEVEIRLSKNNRVLYARMSIKKIGVLLVAIFLINIPREVSIEWWAINKRAFEIVRDSLQIE